MIELPKTQIGYETGTFSSNIQEAFKAHVNDLRKNHQILGRVAKTVPEQLLLVTRHTWSKPIPAISVVRTYYGFLLGKRSPEFRALAEAQFMIFRGQCQPRELYGWGEPPKIRSSKPRDMTYLRIREENPKTGSTFLGASLNGRHLVLQYGTSGLLETIDPFGDIYKTPLKFHEGRQNLLEIAGGLASLQQKEPSQIRINPRFSYLFSPDSNSVTVDKFIYKKLSDKLVLPLQVHQEQVVDRLFHPETIADPVNAPTELDRSWRSANIFHVLGIEWFRY